MKAYTVYASTGCSCCSYENHYRGPYRDRSDAEQAIAHFSEIKLLASQYARSGRYNIYGEHDAEILPDGRVIIDTRIFPGFVSVDDTTSASYIGREF